MSLTLITVMTTLRVVVGLAGAGYAIYSNRIDGKAGDVENVGSFNYGEIPKAIFGQVIGGIFYDLLKGGTAAGYEQYLQRIDAQEAHTLNHDLQRAARKATLLATFFACQGCLADIKSERQSIWKRFKNIAWKDEDINWLVAVSKQLKDEIKNIETAAFDEKIDFRQLFSIFDKDNIASSEAEQKKLAEELKKATLREIELNSYVKLGGHLSVAFSPNAFDLLSEAVNNGWEQYTEDKDFTIQLKLTANGKNVKKYEWFHLLCVIFNEEYKVNEKIEAAMQKQTALEQTSLLKQISNSLQTFGQVENFRELERQIEDFREENFRCHEVTHELLFQIRDILRGQMRNFTQPLQVHNLPPLTEKVYGRDNEKAKVLESLTADGRRFSLIVAPSGFGKTRLLAKVLQDVTDGRSIKPESAGKITRLMLIDCRLVQNLTDITRELNTVLGTQIVFESRLRNYNEAWCKTVFELIDGTTWLFLDNFEAWLDASNGYQLINIEIRAFLNALFGGNHGLRGAFLSQSEPESDVLNNLNKLREVGAELFKGLDKDSALLYLHENANAENGLDSAPESLRVKFLEDVSYIPQALNSLIGYLDSISGYTFADFMDKENGFWKRFDEAESDETALANGIRRTKALIKQQILQQSEEVKLLMKVLTFFARPVPREALELLFSNKAQAANPISRLTSHNLATVSTGIRGTKYYELHTYFSDVTSKTLAPIEINITAGYASLLLAKGLEEHQKRFLNRSTALTECAEQILEFLLKTGIEVRNSLITIYINKGTDFVDIGRINDGIEQYKKAIELNKVLVLEGKREAVTFQLGMMYWGKGYAFSYIGKLTEAITELDEAIKIFEELCNKDSEERRINDLTKIYLVKSAVLADLGRLDEAIDESKKAIEILEELVNEMGRAEMAESLAQAYMSQGVTLKNGGRIVEAIAEYDKAIVILKKLVNEKGQIEQSDNLAMAYMNKGNAFLGLNRLQEAVAEHNKAIVIYEELVNNKGRIEIAHTLAMAYGNIANVLNVSSEYLDAVRFYDKASVLWQRTIDEGNEHLLPDYLKLFPNRIDVLIKLKDWHRAASDAVEAFGHISLLVNPEVPNHFQQRIQAELIRIIQHFVELPPAKREEIYKHAGENGEIIRHLVEQFEKSSPSI